MDDETIETRDCHGALLENGDAVQLIKDLKVGGSSLNLKRGETVKVRLVGDPDAVECRIGKATIVLRTEFLKKKK